MIELTYLFALSLALFAIGLAGIASDRHFIVIMLAVELILVASTVALVSFFSYAKASSADPVMMLFSIFAVAAAEIVTVVTFYVYMKHHGVDFDISRLSKMKW